MINNPKEKEDVDALIAITQSKGIDVCLGIYSDEAFKRLSVTIEFSGVIRFNGKTINYNDC